MSDLRLIQKQHQGNRNRDGKHWYLELFRI